MSQGYAALDLRRLYRLDWAEGLLLEPHHFRWMEARADALLHYRFEVSLGDSWGLVSLDDNDAAGGVYRVKTIEAMMRDGTPVRYPADGLIGAAPLEVEIPPHGGTVHLCLAHDDAERDQATSGRVVLQIEKIETTCCSPELSLFVVDETHSLPARAISLPLITLRPSARGGFERVLGLDPPMLRLLDRSECSERARRLCERLGEKARRRREEYVQFVRTNKHDLAAARRVDLQAVTAAQLRLLEVLQRRAHPRELYLQLVDALGRLSALTPTANEPRLHVYEHDNPTRSIAKLVDAIEDLLARGIPDHFEMFALEYGVSPPFRADTRSEAFSVVFEPEWQGRELILAARGLRGVPADKVAAWVSQAHICGESRLAEVRRDRKRGLVRALVDRHREWVIDEGMVGFVLEYDKTLISPGERLFVLNAVTNENIAPPADLTLYVRRERSLGETEGPGPSAEGGRDA